MAEDLTAGFIIHCCVIKAKGGSGMLGQANGLQFNVEVVLFLPSVKPPPPAPDRSFILRNAVVEASAEMVLGIC